MAIQSVVGGLGSVVCRVEHGAWSMEQAASAIVDTRVQLSISAVLDSTFRAMSLATTTSSPAQRPE